MLLTKPEDIPIRSNHLKEYVPFLRLLSPQLHFVLFLPVLCSIDITVPEIMKKLDCFIAHVLRSNIGRRDRASKSPRCSSPTDFRTGGVGHRKGQYRSNNVGTGLAPVRLVGTLAVNTAQLTNLSCRDMLPTRVGARHDPYGHGPYGMYRSRRGRALRRPCSPFDPFI